MYRTSRWDKRLSRRAKARRREVLTNIAYAVVFAILGAELALVALNATGHLA